jgi:hypothetical protein
MKLRTLFWSTCIFAAMAASTVPAAAAAAHECVPGKVTAASYTWDFKGEANTILKDVQAEAQQALNHADRLQALARDNNVDWEIHAGHLSGLRSEINDIGDKLCRLETIRRVLAPWQQRVVDQVATTTRLLADNAQDAIVFGNDNREGLWLASYQRCVNNLYNEAKSLTRSVGNAVEFAGVSKEYRDLGHNMGVKSL